MRTVHLFTLTLIALFVLGHASIGHSDCCKIPIPPCPPGENPTPPGGDQPPGEPPGEIPPEDDFGEVPPLSDTTASEMLAKGRSFGGFFEEDLQQAVIGWNGKQEVLILTTNEESIVGDTPMLSVMPLPGKPLDISRANKRAFQLAKKLVASKLALASGPRSQGVFMERTIGSHQLFVWAIEDIDQFPARVQAYISRKYNGRAKALITHKTLRVIKSYYDRGFRYFAFDLVMVPGAKSTKEAIAYHFNSNFCYYPMVISSAGGKGNTVADLVIFSSDEFTRLDGIPRDKFTVLGDRSVAVSHHELRSIDPKLASLFPPNARLRGRNVLIPGKLEQFKADFVAR